MIEMTYPNFAQPQSFPAWAQEFSRQLSILSFRVLEQEREIQSLKNLMLADKKQPESKAMQNSQNLKKLKNDRSERLPGKRGPGRPKSNKRGKKKGLSASSNRLWEISDDSLDLPRDLPKKRGRPRLNRLPSE